MMVPLEYKLKYKVAKLSEEKKITMQHISEPTLILQLRYIGVERNKDRVPYLKCTMDSAISD